MNLMVITHNIMILLPMATFLQSLMETQKVSQNAKGVKQNAKGVKQNAKGVKQNAKGVSDGLK